MGLSGFGALKGLQGLWHRLFEAQPYLSRALAKYAGIGQKPSVDGNHKPYGPKPLKPEVCAESNGHMWAKACAW